jgi:hypothetical protein
MLGVPHPTVPLGCVVAVACGFYVSQNTAAPRGIICHIPECRNDEVHIFESDDQGLDRHWKDYNGSGKK